MSLLELVLIVGATVRLTRLAQTDSITAPLRAPLLRRAKARGDDIGMYELLFCPWCLSIWVGAAVAASWCAWGNTEGWLAVTAMLTASEAAGIVAVTVDR